MMYIAMDMGTSNTRVWLCDNSEVVHFIKIPIGAGITKTKGKDFSTEQRIKYDLAILVSKYDGYLKWLETQKLIEIEPKIENDNLITNDIYIKKTDSNQKDLSDVIDDIFDGSDCL